MNADKILMTEDSDYGVHGETVAQKVFVYMRDQMGLSVVTSKGFLEIFNVQLPCYRGYNQINRLSITS